MANSIKHHLTVYGKTLKLSAMLETEYRFSFILEIVVEVAFFAATIVSFFVIFSNVNDIAGWNRYQTAVLYGINMIFSETILGIAFIFNLRELPYKIIRGQLDMLLTRPINALFAATLWRPYFAFIPSSIAGICLAGWGFTQGNFSLSFQNILFFIAFYIPAIVIAYSVGTIVSCLSFWIQNAEPLPYLAQQFIFIAKHPYDIYSGIWRWIFLLFIPTAFMVTFPTRAHFGTISFWWLIPARILASLFLFITRLVWNLGLKSYESASI
jgi:ABC-2 type transport system permease protein